MFDKLFLMFSVFFTIGGALGMVFVKNIIHSCMFLLASLFGVAGLYATLNADFLAVVQLVVYAGGVIILMLFAIMLSGGTQNMLNRFGLKKISSMGNKKTYILAIIFSCFMVSIVYKVLINIKLKTENLSYKSTVEEIGVLLVTDHILAFEISSILLIGALVGASVISRPNKDN